MDNVNLENQMSIDDFLGTLLQQTPKKKAPKRATSKVTEETRRESNEATDKKSLRNRVLELLDGRELTAREIAMEMYRIELLPYPARSLIQPRISELAKSGAIKAVGAKFDTSTKRNVAVYKVV